MGTPRWRPPEGQFPATCPQATIGWLIKHFNYDGNGRLYRTSSRLDPSLLAEGYAYAGGGVANRSERFFYDGTRRIQELITDPVVVNNEDGDVATMGEENEQRGGGGGGSGGGGGDGAGQQPGPVITILYLKTQYVWGPGDSPTAGVDELLMQQDTNGKQWYPLQDAQGDVVSLIHLPLGAGTPQAEVAGQWTYSPYGEVLTYEQFHPHPAITHGHKGLAIDRLDAPALSWDTATSSLSDTPRLMPGAKLLGYNRGRTTNFALGRFMQADPNASGLALQSSILFHGVATSAFEATVKVQTRLGDGLNLFGYLGSNPLTRDDPMGLSWDPFDDMVDDFLITNAASTAAFMGQLRSGFNTTAHITWQIAQLHPAVAIAASAYQISTNGFSLSAVASAVPGAAAGKILMKAGAALASARAAYATTGRVGKAARVAKAKSTLPADFHGGAKTYSLYVGYDNAGSLKYVGITNNVDRRQDEWDRKDKKYRISRVAKGLAFKQARALESYYMITRAIDSADNKNLSIAEAREWFDEAMDWAARYTP